MTRQSGYLTGIGSSLYFASVLATPVLHRISNDTTLVDSIGNGHDMWVWREGQKPKQTFSNTTNVEWFVSPDREHILFRSSMKGTGNSFSLLDIGSSKYTKNLFTNQKQPVTHTWIKLAGGGYNLLLEPAPSSGQPVTCVRPKTAVTKQLGKAGSSLTVSTTKAGVPYVTFHDTAAKKMLLGKLDDCSVATAHSGAATYGKARLTPDEKAVIFTADGAIRISTLDGKATAQLTATGTYQFMAGKWLYYQYYADSPKGKIAATLAVPLVGGPAIPVDQPMTTHWKGTGNGVMYTQKALRYLDLK